MSMFTVPIAVGHPNGGDLYPVRPLVDTGSAHSTLPASLLASLNVAPLQEQGFILADGSRVRYGYGVARFNINGMERPCPVIFGPEGKYLLGRSAMAIFNLEADHAGGKLRPMEAIPLGWGGDEVPKSAGQSILEIFDKIHQSMPEGAFDELPKDGAANLKHYLYGWPKEDER